MRIDGGEAVEEVVDVRGGESKRRINHARAGLLQRGNKPGREAAGEFGC